MPRMLSRPPIGVVLRRGLRRRCPRCGEGPLFRRGLAFLERCPVCHLLYQRDRGDTWIFMVFIDRLPMVLGIAVVYFGYRSTGWIGAIAFFVVLAVPMIATLRERQGLALALDYLSRIHFRDPSDEIHAA